jgi:hypothetical protein
MDNFTFNFTVKNAVGGQLNHTLSPWQECRTQPIKVKEVSLSGNTSCCLGDAWFNSQLGQLS